MTLEWRHRLKSHIEATPGLSMKSVSLRAGLNETAVRDILNRGVSPTIDNFRSIAEAAGLSPMQLLGVEDYDPPSVPVVGFVSAGEGWTPADDVEPETVAVDVAGADMIALHVRGDSMAPVYRHGDVLICNRLFGMHAHNSIGMDCIVGSGSV